MAFNEKFYIGSAGFSHCVDLGNRIRFGFGRWEQAGVTKRIAFESGQTRCCFSQRMGDSVIGRVAVKPTIGPDLVAHLPAEKLPYGCVERLAFDVP